MTEEGFLSKGLNDVSCRDGNLCPLEDESAIGLQDSHTLFETLGDGLESLFCGIVMTIVFYSPRVVAGTGDKMGGSNTTRWNDSSGKGR